MDTAAPSVHTGETSEALVVSLRQGCLGGGGAPGVSRLSRCFIASLCLERPLGFSSFHRPGSQALWEVCPPSSAPHAHGKGLCAPPSASPPVLLLLPLAGSPHTVAHLGRAPCFPSSAHLDCSLLCCPRATWAPGCLLPLAFPGSWTIPFFRSSLKTIQCHSSSVCVLPTASNLPLPWLECHPE